MEDPGPTHTRAFKDRPGTVGDSFYVTPGGGMNVPGPGSLDSLLVIADTDQFGVRVESEEASLADDYYTDLEPWSDEFDHISAYQTSGGDYVISVKNFPYRESVRVKVLVPDSVFIQRVRAIYTIGRETDY